MRTVSGLPLSPIGIGSYGIGGRGHRNVELVDKNTDDLYIQSLQYAFEHGCNFTELSMGYGHGESVRLFAKALEQSRVDRKDLFITHSLYPVDLPDIPTIEKDIADFYTVLGTDYADSTLVTQSLFDKFDSKSITGMLRNLLDSNKTRYVSLSNASPDFIRWFRKEFGERFVAHEGHLSFEIRSLQDKGVFTTCDELGVTNIIWRPLRRGATSAHDWPLLTELVQKYHKTPNQIILNWICNLGYHPMVMSSNHEHMHENISAPDFTMDINDYKALNNFRPVNYTPPAIDWEKNSEGDSIVMLVNDFEKHLTK